MKASSAIAHTAGVLVGSAVWLTGLHLPAGTPAWWLSAVGPAGVTTVTVLSFLCAHHQDALTGAVSRTASSPAVIRNEVAVR